MRKLRDKFCNFEHTVSNASVYEIVISSLLDGEEHRIARKQI
jgi:hypothetical protein